MTAGPGEVTSEPGRRRGDYARELSELRRVLDESPVVGHLRRDAEIAELRRLITRYPAEARDILQTSGDKP